MLEFVVHVKLVGEHTDWAAWTTAGATVVTTIIVAATAWVARNSLRDARRTRHGQLLVDLNEWWASDAIKASAEQYGSYRDEDIAALVERISFGRSDPTPADIESFETLSSLANFIENIGVLHDEGALTAEVIYKNWGSAIVGVWSAWRLAVPKLRELPEQADTYRFFENVSHEVRKISKRRQEELRPEIEVWRAARAAERLAAIEVWLVESRAASAAAAIAEGSGSPGGGQAAAPKSAQS